MLWIVDGLALQLILLKPLGFSIASSILFACTAADGQAPDHARFPARRALRPVAVLFPIIMAFCCIGIYSVNANIHDLFAVAFFGLLGYVLLKLRCEPAPLLLGFVPGPMLEENLRRAMILGRGDPTISSPARSA